MGFINANLNDVQEPQYVPEGEYDLRVVKKEDKESKKGKPMTVLHIRIEDAPVRNAQLVQHYLNHPYEGLPADQIEMRLLELKRVCALFGVEWGANGFDTDDFQGRTGRCLLVQEEGDDKVVRNRLKLPRLKG
jgi:hypothetical protein